MPNIKVNGKFDRTAPWCRVKVGDNIEFVDTELDAQQLRLAESGSGFILGFPSTIYSPEGRTRSENDVRVMQEVSPVRSRAAKIVSVVVALLWCLLVCAWFFRLGANICIEQ